MKIQTVRETVLFAVLLFGMTSFAEQTTGEKIDAGAGKVKNKVVETYREAKDETCEMINGKMECVGKKIMNKGRNAKDKVKSKVDETVDKVD